jgi:hypothetical protein
MAKLRKYQAGGKPKLFLNEYNLPSNEVTSTYRDINGVRHYFNVKTGLKVNNIRSMVLATQRQKLYPLETPETKKLREQAGKQTTQGVNNLISGLHPVGMVVGTLANGPDESVPLEGVRFLPNKIGGARGYNNFMPFLKPIAKSVDFIQSANNFRTSDSLSSKADSLDKSLYYQYQLGGRSVVLNPSKSPYDLPLDYNRPFYIDDNGNEVSENKKSFGIDGKEILLPTVFDGVQYSDDEALQRYFQTGERIGAYNTPEEATRASKQRTFMYNLYGKNGLKQYQSGGFTNAFKIARRKNLQTFSYNGKLYNTDYKHGSNQSGEMYSPSRDGNISFEHDMNSKPVSQPVTSKPVSQPINKTLVNNANRLTNPYVKPVSQPVASKPVSQPINKTLVNNANRLTNPYVKPVSQPVASKPVSRAIAPGITSLTSGIQPLTTYTGGLGNIASSQNERKDLSLFENVLLKIAGIKERLIPSMGNPEENEIVDKKLNIATEGLTRHGYKELYTIKDNKGSEKDSIVSYTYTGDNDTGTVFNLGNMVASHTNERIPGKAVAHFVMDGETILPGKDVPLEYKDAKGSVLKSSFDDRFSNYFIENGYNMYQKKNKNGSYNIVYKKEKDKEKYLKKGFESYSTVRSFKFSDIDFDGEGPNTGFLAKSKYIPLKGKGNTSIPYSNKNAYNRFNGGSGVYIYIDPITKREKQVNVTGSVNTLKSIGLDIIKNKKILPDELTFLYHDMGSYSAKPKAQDGFLNYKQWKNFNTYNRGYSGAPIIIPNDAEVLVDDLPQKQKGGYINNTGYTPGYKSFKNPYNIIPSSNITMRNTPFPVLGIDDLGNKQMMYPGNDYKYPGSKVLEIPQNNKQLKNKNMNYYQQGGMSPEQPQGGQDQMQQVMQQVMQMLQQGADPQQVLQQLVQMGIPQDQAQQLLQMAMQQGQGPQQGQQMMMYGGMRPKTMF